LTTPDDGPSLVLHARPDDLEAAVDLEFVAAHLAEFRRARVDVSATAALVVGDPDRCAELMAAGLSTVYLHPAGAAPGDPGTADVSATIVNWQVPSWLTQTCSRERQFARSEIRVANVAPPRRVRSAGGDGPAVQLTGGCPDPEQTVAALRSALRDGGPAAGPIPVLTDLAAADWARLAGGLGEFAFARVDVADWPRALRRADLLVAGPTLLATTFAQSANLPLRLLPAAGIRQSRVREALGVLAGGADDRTDLIVIPDVWPVDIGRAGTLGGAAQLARQIRQLCLAPV
jgi:CGA synthase-related protein